MRVGFLHFAVPGIGAIHAQALHRVTSDEMRPWSVGGPYDKPIPRRMAEEGGVSRHLFGLFKMGGPKTRPRSRSLRGRLRRLGGEVVDWAPLRALILGTIGHRLHPRWRMGSLDVQIGAAKMVERYRRAIADQGDAARNPARVARPGEPEPPRHD